ncbi:MAG: hypothetical protein AAB728_05060 [Patescibacteria group bacterium]
MQRTCRQCSASFQVTPSDLAFYEKVSPTFHGKKELIPPPTLCADCRQQRRLAQANQLNLYERKCDLTGASIISNIHPGAPCKVYRQQDWYSDKWDPLEYGREWDPSRPFFAQLKELLFTVPRPNVFTGFEFDENSEYTNHAGKNKDCYLIFDSDECRSCYYSYSINNCMDCADCFRTRKSELCYECVDCVRCYASAFLQDCDNCADSMFLKNCTGCKHSLMCSNLRNKEYFVENKPVSKEEFMRFRSLLGSRDMVLSAKERFGKLKLEHPQKYMHGVQNEGVLGDYLVNCKDAYLCYDSEDLWDCRHAYQGFMPLKNCMDVQECGDAELLYECCVCGYGMKNSGFCTLTLTSVNDVFYCHHCHHVKNCFGCVGLNRKEYCILNKQYTKEEYERLVPKIIEHMRKTPLRSPDGSFAGQEWGEFIPAELSIHGYNETLAQDYNPLTKAQVEERGWKWFDKPEASDQYMGPPVVIPDSIADADDSVCANILRCEATGKPFKIIPQELKLCQRLNVPLPRKTFFQRHQERMALRNPRKLWKRSCAKCQKEIETTYAPDRPEIVSCEQCYLSSVY